MPRAPKGIVRRGYDAVSERYRADDDEPPACTAWLADLRARLPAVASVLDLGCGAGVLISRTLADPDAASLSFGGGERMWWSDPGAGTYRRRLTSRGLTIERDEFVPEGSGGHQMLPARRG